MSGPGASGGSKPEPQPELAQDRDEPQGGRAGPRDDEPHGGDRGEHQEYGRRLRHHQHRQAGRQQEEDARPQPSRPLEEAVQARLVGSRLPQRDYFSREAEIESLIRVAWEQRIVITVIADAHELERPVKLILRRAPPQPRDPRW